MSQPQDDKSGILIGVVLPVYQHSGLISEALCSLESQVDAPPFVGVVVNDGCPYRETDLVCRAFSRSSKMRRLHYVKRENGGLSAARNVGIELLLATYPDLHAIYFLDADNRLKPFALAKMKQALIESPEADWFYPDIQMFGLNIVSQYDGDYSSLAHTATNISEAGSLVRRRVFEAGNRFDEGMRQGFEDWDFWLGARERGFRGHHLKNLGFEYRKRPESMLADSHRDQAEIKAYMRRKRQSIFQIKNLLALEVEEAPRYAFVLDGLHVHLGFDFDSESQRIPFEELTRRLWAWLLQPTRHFFPPFVIWTSESAFLAAQSAGILNWCCWDLECRIANATCSATTLLQGRPHEFGIDAPISTFLAISLDAHMVMLQANLLREICLDRDGCKWLGEVLAQSAKLSASTRQVRCAASSVQHLSPRRTLPDLVRSVAYFHSSEYATSIEIDWKWTFTGLPARHTAYLTVRAAANEGVVMPVKPDGRRHIGLLLSFADFGGVEKVAFNVAKVLRAAGYVPHLVLFRTGDIIVPPTMADVFGSYSWVTSDNLLRWDGDKFYGTELSWWSQHGDRTNVVGLLSWFDAVLNCQSADAHGVMGELRRRGVLTLTHQHIVEMSPAGRPGGSAMIARAFEHSYAAILTGSRKLYSWFIANGIPQEKLFNVDNAASYEVDVRVLEEIAQERAARVQRGGALRVLFAARMDVQKGLDRVVSIIKGSRAMKLQWRVVGKPIVAADPLFLELDALCGVEAPVYSEEQLTDLYRWADVIVLPSRYEGVPLTAIEAMRCGAIMLVADAGGIGEIIEDGVDGLIVSQEGCVSDMLEALSRLEHDRSSVLRYALAAMQSGSARTWSGSLSDTLSFLANRLSILRPSTNPRLEHIV